MQGSVDPATLAVHADDDLITTTDVAAPWHLSTTFRYPDDPTQLITAAEASRNSQSQGHIYSRHTAPNLSRLEAVLTALLHAPAITYSSGLSATHAIYSVLRPRQIFITGGYHGVHGVITLLHRVSGACAYVSRSLQEVELCGEGDVIHIETPLNPTGEAQPIAKYAKLAHSRGAYVVVDSTFGPPPIQDPFEHGADVVMHSGTKYFGGHSDMLLGVAATRREDWAQQLARDRLVLGAVPGSAEAWLGIRSLRTLSLRVERQARSAEQLVGRLYELLDGKTSGLSPDDIVAFRTVVHDIKHSTVQIKRHPEDREWIEPQMPRGLHAPVFAIICNTEEFARRWPSKLKYWTHATSLGGVESLIEWRAMTDTTVDTRLLRLSVGVEDPDDLLNDLLQGCRALI